MPRIVLCSVSNLQSEGRLR